MKLICIMLLACSLLSACASDNLDPSLLSVKQGLAVLEKHPEGMTTGSFMKQVKTTPILTSPEVFHWMMADGDIWTKFKTQEKGDPLIIGWKSETSGKQQ